MKDSRIYFTKILGYIGEVQKYVRGTDYEHFAANNEKIYACAFVICQISELAQRFKDEEKKQYSAVPWVAIRAIRNHIIHNYENINKEILWDTIINDLPELAREIEKILKAF